MENTQQQGETGRGPNGRFSEGNQFGVTGGRPKVWNKSEYLKAVQEEVTPERWQLIVHRAVQDATEGSPRERASARDWLGKYLLPQRTEIEFSGSDESPVRIIAVEGFTGWDKKSA